MNDAEKTAALLVEARLVLRERIMPTLAGEARFEAAMIANVMAIAARTLEQGVALVAAEHSRLQGFLGQECEHPLDELCRQIRAGAYDGDAELTSLLNARTKDRLAISNPDYRG